MNYSKDKIRKIAGEGKHDYDKEFVVIAEAISDLKRRVKALEAAASPEPIITPAPVEKPKPIKKTEE